MKPTIVIPSGSHLDGYLMTNRYNTRFQLEEGVYYANNANAFREMDYVMLGNQCELIGEGSGKTFIVLSVSGTDIPDGSGQVEFLTAGGRSTAAHFIKIQGVALAIPFMSLRERRLGSVGVHVWCDRFDIRDVQVIGVEGFRPKGNDDPNVSREGFGMLINRSGLASEPHHGNVVEDVSIIMGDGSPDEGEIYVCGFYVGLRDNVGGFTTVNRVSVTSHAEIPTHAAFGFNGGVQASQLVNHGTFNRGVFCDVSGGSNTIMSNSRLMARSVMMEFRGSKLNWRNIELNDSLLVLRPSHGSAYCAALVLADDGGTRFDNVSINRSTIRIDTSDLPAGSPVPLLTDGSDNGRDTHYSGIFDCRMIGPWSGPTLASSGFSSPNQKPPIK